MRGYPKRNAGVLPAGKKTKGTNAMTQMEIDSLEYASRAALAWSPEGYDGRIHLGAVLGAALSAFCILAVAAAFLFIAA